MAASELPAETLDLLLIYKVVLFPVVIPRCLAASRLIFPRQDESLLHHLFLLADSQLCFQPLIYTLICLFFFCELLSETATFIITASYVSWKPFLGEWLVPVDECWLIAGVRCSVLYHLSHL